MPRTAPLSLATAIEVFVGGFCFLRSFTRPYVAERLDGLWVLRDAPRRTRAGAGAGRGERKREVVAHGVPPATVVETIRHAALPWHFVCHLHGPEEPFEEIRAAYKALGYRALATEWMFAHDLAEVPAYTSDPPPRRVRSEQEAEQIRRARRGRRGLRPLAADVGHAPEPAP